MSQSDDIVIVESTTVAEKATENVAEKTTNVYREQRIASSGMGFLLQQMRTSTTSNSVSVAKKRKLEEDVAQPEVKKARVQPIAVEYPLLNKECVGELKCELVQTIRDCYNEGTTPKFNFAKDCGENNFVRSCKFSPTGTHLITESADRRVRIFDFKDDKLDLKKSILNGDLIYDMIWDRFGENFATASGGSPIKLWNTDGQQMATYHGINHMDELDFAHALAFDFNGEKLYATYRGVLRRFDVNRPGAQISEIKTFDSMQLGQKSILSCIEMSPAMQGVYAIGSFGAGVGLYSDFTNSCDTVVPTQSRFITCLQYSSDGQRLFVGSRKSSVIECFDVRNFAKSLAQYSRPVTNGQRVYLRVDPSDRYMFSGSTSGDIRIFDLANASATNTVVEPTWMISNASKSTVAGLDIHPSEPFIATTHGQRVFPMPLNDENDEADIPDKNQYLGLTEGFDNSLKLWKF
ncbi:hypothetical protein M3Y97_00207500 [Aphelenchoides bicaudatus]|nr:hypothetical protein M3Y97_00207500 [Aphelenchoides bicaudatus]